jgi:hypothetical protein
LDQTFNQGHDGFLNEHGQHFVHLGLTEVVDVQVAGGIHALHHKRERLAGHCVVQLAAGRHHGFQQGAQHVKRPVANVAGQVESRQRSLHPLLHEVGEHLAQPTDGLH